MLELSISSVRMKDTYFYSLHVLKDGEPLPSAGVYFDIEKDGVLWLSNQEFIYSTWANSTTKNPKKNIGNLYYFAGDATFRVREVGTEEWSNSVFLNT